MIIHIGYNNFVEADKVIAITSLRTLQAKRAREDALDEKRYIDCTSNKITRSLIFLEGGQIVGSTFVPKTLRDRINNAGALPDGYLPCGGEGTM